MKSKSLIASTTILVTLLSSNIYADCEYLKNIIVFKIKEKLWAENLVSSDASDIKILDILKKKKKPKIAHYVVIPNSEEEYLRIFNCDDIKRNYKYDKDSLEKAKEKFALINATFAQKEAGIVEFEQFLASLDPDIQYVTLVGHNENSIFKFQKKDDENPNLDDIGRLCNQHGKFCIFLTCSSNNFLDHSNNYGINQNISYDQAYDMAKSISDSLNNYKKELSPLELGEEINRIIRSKEVKYTSYRFIKAGSAISGIIFVSIAFDELLNSFKDKDNEKDKKKGKKGEKRTTVNQKNK